MRCRYRAIQSLRGILNKSTESVDNDPNHNNCPQARYQRMLLKGKEYSSKSGGHTAPQNLGTRYSDIVKGNFTHKYNVPTMNRFAPLN